MRNDCHSTSPKTSLIIATYNQPHFLCLALQSVIEQTRMPDEVVIADNGSREDTAELVRGFKKIGIVPIVYVWQPDEGYRLARSRNNAVAASKGEYLIFLDGDCFLNRHFIEDHLSFAKPNHYVCGTRVNIRPRRKEYILRTGRRTISFFSWGTGKKFHAIRSRLLSKLRDKKEGGVAGANLAAWRCDVEKVNGFNERLSGYAGEDCEFACRLDHSGVIRRKMVHLGIAYHFDHPLTSCVRWSDGNKVQTLMAQIQSEEKHRCALGLAGRLGNMTWGSVDTMVYQ